MRILLLTGTIDSSIFSNVGNRITDISLRNQQYKRSIEKYIKYSVFDKIVFAENSNYAFEVEYFENLALQYNKVFEYVACPSYVEETIQRGKSFGEAKLIDDALKRSKILRDADIIYKLTGRIFLKNSKQICRNHYKYENAFLIYSCKGWCFTNIFKFSKDTYQKYFYEISKECDEKAGKDIERVFYKVVKKMYEDGIKVGSFSQWPYFDGIQGATLEPYSGGKIERIFRNILCKIKCFQFGTFTSKILRF